MEKVLIISKTQFGYLTDVYKWCQYLRNNYDVSLICFDTKKERLTMDNVNIKYVNYCQNKTLRGIWFIIKCIVEILFNRGKTIIVYFDRCEVIQRVLFWKRIHMDIRTLSVLENEQRRLQYDRRLRNACYRFKSVSIIAEHLNEKLDPQIQMQVLPLGSDVISSCPKTINILKLLYVGTLYNRHIEETIEGVSIFVSRNPNVELEYNIIGDGPGEELDNIKSLVEKYNLRNNIIVRGRIPHGQLKDYFDNANIGVSYIPITDYFNYQPPTKTFEYILSGLYCIGTKTYANSIVISEKNGILINDNPVDFADALQYIADNKEVINTLKIDDTLIDYSWENIVKNNLIPIIERL